MMVENFDGWGVDGWVIGWGMDFSYIGVCGEYVEGSIKGKIIDDVEGNEVELVEVVDVNCFVLRWSVGLCYFILFFYE